MVEKLRTLASRNSSADLKRNLCIEGRLKPGNKQIYYIVDALNDAMFHMYSKKPETVERICDNDIMDTIID